VLAVFAEDIEWIIPGEGLPVAGTYRGHSALADFFQKVLEMMEFSSFEARGFVAEGDRVLVVDVINQTSTGVSSTCSCCSWLHRPNI
jgi:hypothetical protein